MACGLIHYNLPDLKTLDDFFEFAAQTGFDAVELMPGDVWPAGEESPEARAEQIREQAEAAGIRICALGAGNNFARPDAEEIQRQVRRMERISRLAKILGAPVVRTEASCFARDEPPYEKSMEANLRGLKRCLDFIERDRIVLAVDNHSFLTNDGDRQVHILKEMDSPYVAATMDTMNYRFAGHDLDTVARFYETVAPHARHTHIKDGTGVLDDYRGRVLGEGEIDIPGAVQTLKNAGYPGVWCIEYEGREGSVGYAKCLQRLKELV